MKIRLIYLILGIIIVLYTLYIRLVLVRLPKNLYLFENNMLNYGLLLIIVLWIISCITIIILSGMLIFQKEFGGGFLKKIMNKINSILNNALFETFSFFVNLIPDNYDKIINVNEIFYVTFSKWSETLFLFINYFIRLVVVSVFLVDVFWFFKLNYFYKSITLLCIPICINIWFYNLKEFSKNLEELKSYLIIENKGNDKETRLPITSYRPAVGQEDIDLHYHVRAYILCLKINGYLEIFTMLSEYYTPRVNIVIYSSYLIGWLYVLYKNFVFIL